MPYLKPPPNPSAVHLCRFYQYRAIVFAILSTQQKISHFDVIVIVLLLSVYASATAIKLIFVHFPSAPCYCSHVGSGIIPIYCAVLTASQFDRCGKVFDFSWMPKNDGFFGFAFIKQKGIYFKINRYGSAFIENLVKYIINENKIMMMMTTLYNVVRKMLKEKGVNERASQRAPARTTKGQRKINH